MTITTTLAAAQSSSGSSQLFLPVMIAIFGLVYFFYIRPRQAKMRNEREQARQAEPGDWVRTIGGVEGQVTSATDTHVVIRTGHVPGEGPEAASATSLTFTKNAVAGKITDPFAAPDLGDDDALGGGAEGAADGGVDPQEES